LQCCQDCPADPNRRTNSHAGKFAAQLSALATKSDAQCQAGFLQLYLRKAPEEVHAIRLANRVANVGLQVFLKI